MPDNLIDTIGEESVSKQADIERVFALPQAIRIAVARKTVQTSEGFCADDWLSGPGRRRGSESGKRWREQQCFRFRNIVRGIGGEQICRRSVALHAAQCAILVA